MVCYVLAAWFRACHLSIYRSINAYRNRNQRIQGVGVAIKYRSGGFARRIVWLAGATAGRRVDGAFEQERVSASSAPIHSLIRLVASPSLTAPALDPACACVGPSVCAVKLSVHLTMVKRKNAQQKPSQQEGVVVAASSSNKAASDGALSFTITPRILEALRQGAKRDGSREPYATYDPESCEVGGPIAYTALLALHADLQQVRGNTNTSLCLSGLAVHASLTQLYLWCYNRHRAPKSQCTSMS